METKPSRRLWIGALLLALLHFAFAIAYSTNTPFLTPGKIYVFQGNGEKGTETLDIGAPDELQHVVLIGRLANGEPYPKLIPQDPRQDFNYQSHQGPLFYEIGALWLKITGGTGVQQFAKATQEQNPQELQAKMKAHRMEEFGGYQNLQSEGIKLRILNALIGALTVIGVFFLGFWASDRESVAYGAAILAGLLPMNVALSSAVSNDPLLFCLCTWTVALLVLASRSQMTVKLAIGVGILAGAALLTKTSALALLPVIVISAIAGRKVLSPKLMGLALGIALVIGGAWWARNVSVYGEPFVQKTFMAAFEGRSPTADSRIVTIGAGNYWSSVMQVGAFSFIGIFSYMDIFLPETIYHFFNLLIVAISLGLVFKLIKEKPTNTLPTWILGSLFVIGLLLFIQFNRQFFQPQARYLFPAIGPIAVAFGGGLRAWFRGKAKYALMGIGAIFVFLNVFVLMILPGNFEARTQSQTETAAQPSNQ